MPNYDSALDEDLLLLLKSNDEAAFTALYNRYWKKLFVMAGYRMGNLEEAEEIVQDIFAALWNRRHTLELATDLAKYLAVSVKYRVIKTLDRHYREQRYIDSVVCKEQVDHSTEEKLSFDELSEELAKYVSQLPERCQLVFRLSREEGLSQKQIAENLQISEKTVEAHLAKAFKTLRIKLGNFMTALL
ncbi:RNA polymerase sigma-70 factor [Parapedobacter sp. 2B3]|uniref:RNA polymerase sigma-70 factor n=1 Tax=Parapedobacter sp. 2B3 TaxID=3342381 RepID=UPI0035B57389